MLTLPLIPLLITKAHKYVYSLGRGEEINEHIYPYNGPLRKAVLKIQLHDAALLHVSHLSRQFLACCSTSGLPRNFVWGGGSTNSVDRTERTAIWRR